jgi:uncharacterized protein YigA (DUF484 family)
MPMITAQDVCRFLEKQPDFFVDHPELLEALHVPHRTDGQTVSLVERQVKVLRANQAETRQRLATLIRNARDNEALVGHMHRLALRLIAAKIAAPAGAPTALEQLAPLVEAAMREDFGVSPARLLAPAAVPENLRALLSAGTPHCGRLREDDRHALLGAAAEGVGSMALVPLGAGAAQGLLVLGSADTVHFHPGMATDFLARIAELLSTALAAATVAPAAPT